MGLIIMSQEIQLIQKDIQSIFMTKKVIKFNDDCFYFESGQIVKLEIIETKYGEKIQYTLINNI